MDSTVFGPPNLNSDWKIKLRKMFLNIIADINKDKSEKTCILLRAKGKVSIENQFFFFYLIFVYFINLTKF